MDMRSRPAAWFFEKPGCSLVFSKADLEVGFGGCWQGRPWAARTLVLWGGKPGTSLLRHARRANARLAVKSKDQAALTQAKKVISGARKNATAFEHLRAIDNAMHQAQDWGLEKFLPEQRLLPGHNLELAPPDPAARPILVFRMDQAHSGFQGGWYVLEVTGLRGRCAWDGPHRKWNDAKLAAAQSGMKGARVPKLGRTGNPPGK